MDNINRTNEWGAALHALMWAVHNIDPADVVRWAYGEGHHPSYIEEKSGLFRRNPTAFIAGLDRESNMHFVEGLRAKYEDELAERYNL